MAPRKLSDSDKSAIIELYQQPDQTTSTLAAQYGVSNSTISRILKTTLPPEAYAQLISQKRMAGSDKTDTSSKKKQVRKQPAADTENTEPEPSLPEESTAEVPRVEPPKLKTLAEKETKKSETARRRRRGRDADVDEQLPLLTENDQAEEIPSASAASSQTKKPSPVPVLTDDDDDDDDLMGLDETLGDDFGDDDDLDDEDDDLDDDAADFPKPKLQSELVIEIMPLGSAVLPKPCYLVVDMRSELITRPLSDFADLGQIPTAEEKAKTLPVFDNHRVARRFSHSKQRVIKVPDGNLITRTSPYLQAKGITRLLVDGQVFDLMSDE